MAALKDEHDEGRRTSPFYQRARRHTHTVTEGPTEQAFDDQEPTTDMIASFYSEGGRDSSSRRVSWSIERHRDRAASVGHAIRRPPGLIIPTDVLISSQSPISDAPPSHEAHNFLESTIAKGSSATRRGSTLIFLGVWALFSFGTLTLQGPTYSDSSTKVGRVLSSVVYDVPSVPVAFLANRTTHAHGNIIRSLDIPQLTIVNQPTIDKLDYGERSSERMIGRIFAWLCATLYFTARLPQIWKNVGFLTR